MADGTLDVKPEGLALLRMPFSGDQISKLPKPTRSQTDAVKADFRAGHRCGVCNGWHHPDVVHLDYVGHAALTHRLLDCDAEWNWEPLATDERGLPLIQNGGLWIKLTVCGVTRLGFGDAPGKKEATKEIIGDALRNAAMRFGAALDLWHKGDLHAGDNPEDEPETKGVVQPDQPSVPKQEDVRKSKAVSRDDYTALQATLRGTNTRAEQTDWWKANKEMIMGMHREFEDMLTIEMRERAESYKQEAEEMT